MYFDHCVVAWLVWCLCVTTGDLYILPKFATVLTCPSWYIHYLRGVVPWSDRNPEGRYQVPCKLIFILLSLYYVLYIFVCICFSVGGMAKLVGWV